MILLSHESNDDVNDDDDSLRDDSFLSTDDTDYTVFDFAFSFELLVELKFSLSQPTLSYRVGALLSLPSGLINYNVNDEDDDDSLRDDYF